MLTMHHTEPSIDVTVTINEDDTLTLAFAKFVRTCEIIGYQDGSWENLLKLFNGDFKNLSIWAIDTIYQEDAEF